MSAGWRGSGRDVARPLPLVGAAVALALLAGCSGGAAATAPTTAAGVNVPGATVFSAAERRPVPDVSGATLDGRPLRLRDLVGEVVVVNVWASWCTSCRAESAVLAAAARDSAGVRFVGIDEEDSAPAARSLVAASGTAYPQLVDADGAILQRLTVLPSTGIPSTLLLDGSGRMAARVVGPVTRPVLSRLIAAVQKGV